MTSAAGGLGANAIDTAKSSVGRVAERNTVEEDVATPNAIAEFARGEPQPDPLRAINELGTRLPGADEEVTTPNAIAEAARKPVQAGPPHRKD
jgi:hypothetical protein